MKTTWTRNAVVLLMVMMGCGGNSVEEFRDAAPSSLGIDIAMRRAKGDGLVGDPALMPGVTALTAFLVNGSVALVLGRVGEVVATEPQQLTANAAEWGPVSKQKSMCSRLLPHRFRARSAWRLKA